jgi:MerR family transcriptional regulator/heat shock protein HspR
MVRHNDSDPSRGVYGISVAASLVGNAPQNLRLYEARGLLYPARSEGGTRLYSENDLARLREIGQLLDNGLNLAGIQMVLSLQETNERLQKELDDHATLTRDERAGSPRRRPREPQGSGPGDEGQPSRVSGTLRSLGSSGGSESPLPV